MDWARASGAQGLLRRVRWGNLGKLVALVAAGLLLATAGGGGQPERVSTYTPEMAPKVDTHAGGREKRRAAPEGRAAREKAERVAPKKVGQAAPGHPERVAPESVGQAAPGNPARVAPQDVGVPPPPTPRSGEFTPDPAP